MGIEPTSEAWEASILPLYDARSRSNASQNITASAAHARTRYSEAVPVDYDGPSVQTLRIAPASPP